MATSSDGGGGGDQRRLLSIPKEGERIIAPTRRPDGTLRKAIRIRAGYVPQEEVAIYQSKGALMRKSGPDVPPGYDPALAVDAKPKTKAAKRNERRKEKRQQIRLAEAQLQGDPEKLKSETQEKLKKIEGWHAELKLLEDKRAPTGS
nr:unnamed protein product [Digitaria exilis]